MPPNDALLVAREAAEGGSGSTAHRALVVEDHAAMRQMMTTLLTAAGWRTVHQAATVTQAIELVVTRRPKFVLVDLRLPDGTGEEVVRAVRDNPDTRGATVVVMTADTDQELRARLMAAGADGYVLKSAGLAAIRQTITTTAHQG